MIFSKSFIKSLPIVLYGLLAIVCSVLALLMAGTLSGCSLAEEKFDEPIELEVNDTPKDANPSTERLSELTFSAKEFRTRLNITEDYRSSFVHGDKGAEYQKYIVLHDTEGDADGESVVNFWDGNGAGIAAHFVVNKDGSIVQCVDMDAIAHHAGVGDTGNNARYGVSDESRDDKVGTKAIGNGFADYGMNSFSIGIEMVHVGGSGDYPAAQLEALDALIAYIDAYYGNESQIIDHKAWRSGNSDTSPEFATYLENYQNRRKHA